jgi:hypothetical protein
VSREAPAPFCERLTGQFRGSTHRAPQALKGKDDSEIRMFQVHSFMRDEGRPFEVEFQD